MGPVEPTNRFPAGIEDLVISRRQVASERITQKYIDEVKSDTRAVDPRDIVIAWDSCNC